MFFVYCFCFFSPGFLIKKPCFFFPEFSGCVQSLEVQETGFRPPVHDPQPYILVNMPSSSNSGVNW